MLGASAINIGVTMFLKDQFSGPSRRVNASAKSMSANVEAMQEAQLRHVRNINAGLAFMGVSAIRGLGRMIGVGAEFEYTMLGVKAVSQATQEEFINMGNEAKRLGKATMFMASDVASAMKFMGMAGMKPQEILGNIEAAVNLAGATQSQLGGKGGAADILTNVMKGFQLSSKDSAYATDILTSATVGANTSLFDLGEAIKYTASTSKDMNISLEETTAMIMALGNAGIQGSMAGTALENSMRYLARTMGTFGTKKQKSALNMIGLSPSDLMDARGNMLPMIEVIQKMGKAIDENFGAGMNVDKQGALQTIFGVRGKRAGSLLLRNLKDFETFVNEIKFESMGKSVSIMDEMMAGLQGNILKVKSAWETFKITVTETLAPLIKGILVITRHLIDFVGMLFKIPILGKFMSRFLAIFLVVKTVSFAYRSVMAGIHLLTGQVGAASLNMGIKGKGAFNMMSASAMRYNTILGSIIKRTGTISVLGRTGFKTGAQFKRTVTGRTGRAGQFVSKEVADRYTRRYGMGRLFGGLGGGLLGGGLTKILTKGGLGGLLKGVRMISSKIPGWGLLITTLTFIPDLINVFKKNKDSTDDNTDAVDNNTNKLNVIREQVYMSKPSTTANEAFDKFLIQKYAREAGLENYTIDRSQGYVNIYVDGEKKINEEIKKKESKDIYNTL